MNKGMRAGYQQIGGCRFELLTKDEIVEIHRATLEVLNDAGVLVLDDEAQEIFYSHGCEVDTKTKIVKIPPYLVEEAINSAPSKVLLAARNPKYDLVLEGNRVAYTNFGVALKIIDLDTCEVRDTTNKDLVDAVKLIDATDEIGYLYMPLDPRDVPYQVADLVAAETCLNNSSKHLMHTELLSGKGAKSFFDMAVAIVGSAEEVRRRPIISVAICPVSPLQLNTDICQVAVETARLGIPFNVVTQALSGGTCPVTLAGTLVIHNAEALAAITLNQLAKKGAPVIYGSSTTILDLRYVNAPVGSPELGMISAAVACLGQYYNLPTHVAGT